MIFNNQRINDILAEYFNFREPELTAFAALYEDYVIKTITGEALTYIEDNNLPDLEEYRKFLDANKEANYSMNTQIDLIRFVFSLYSKYPHLEKKVREEIHALWDSLIADLIPMLDEETALKIADEMEKDIGIMDRYTAKLKGWGYQMNPQ
jgi:hypothetical protein